jgi:glycosyltransferase involved in cell wall biosynthesis
MKYPNVIFFRYNHYSYIDKFFEINKDNLLCSVTTTSDKLVLNKLFDLTYHILVTFGDKKDAEYCADVNEIIVSRIRGRWIHFDSLDDINNFNSAVNYCYIDNVTKKHENTRPIFSIFTTCYNSYVKILRAYNSLQKQKFRDWEWVILDDSPDDEHFAFLKKIFKDDCKIRLYKRSTNSGSIGNVKNEVVSLCRGKYVLEMDHDDEILPNVLLDSVNVFDKDEDVGFIYMDYTNIYENGDNYTYRTNHFALGYACYYRQKYNNTWVYVATNPNINNISLKHIVSVPNHPRIWRKDALLKMGNYSEFLPISDDYELLLRTAVHTKMVNIHKLGYIQYMNNNNNNFSLIRNSEINRLRFHLTDHCYRNYDIENVMKEKNGYEDHDTSQIWKRGTNYKPAYCNDLVNLDYKHQYCIVGLEALYKNIDKIKELYNDDTNDFILLDNNYDSYDNTLCNELDKLHLDRIKCYSMNDCTEEELIQFFHLIYKSCDDYSIFQLS